MIDGGRPVGTADMKMKCDRAKEAGEANQVALISLHLITQFSFPSLFFLPPCPAGPPQCSPLPPLP
jgi:hypothetical protein